MDIKDFHRLFVYDAWANREVLDGLRKHPLARGIELLSHVLASQTLWLERLRDVPQSQPVWPDSALEKCEAHLAELSRVWPEYLNEIGDVGLQEIILYQNTRGEAWNNRVADILQHVIMHSVYHRGQIATAMRAADNTPAYTDFIHGVRHGFVE